MEGWREDSATARKDRRVTVGLDIKGGQRKHPCEVGDHAGISLGVRRDNDSTS